MPARTEADQPTQCLSSYRHTGVHAARRCRVLQPASGDAVLCRCRTDLGADPGGREATAATDGRAASRTVADRRGHRAAPQDAWHIRLWPHRHRGRGLWACVRHERPGVVRRGVVGPRPQGRVCGRPLQAGALRGQRRAIVALTLVSGDSSDCYLGRSRPDETDRDPGEYQPGAVDRGRRAGESTACRAPRHGGGRCLRKRAGHRRQRSAGDDGKRDLHPAHRLCDKGRIPDPVHRHL